MNEQSNLKRHQHCPMRTHVGNCLIIGGFCTSIRKDICDALHKSFKMGTRSRAVDKANDDAISREYIKTLLENNLTGTCKDVVVHTIENAPSVLPKRSCYRCGLREHCEDSTVLTAERR